MEYWQVSEDTGEEGIWDVKVHENCSGPLTRALSYDDRKLTLQLDGSAASFDERKLTLSFHTNVPPDASIRQTRMKIETEILIDATPSRVWKVS